MAIGMKKRERKLINARKHSEKTRYRPPKFVSYCPECRPEQPSKPQFSARVGVNPVKPVATAKCKAGHVWEIKRKVRL